MLLLLAGFALFFAAYQVYSNVMGLGGIDGLTPLPEAYFPSSNPDDPPLILPPGRANVAERKLQQAFGDASEELKRAIKLDIPNRGMVLAVDDFEILPEPENNKVKFTPFSLALFGKGQPEGEFPQINLIRANEAILELDGPIKNQTEIGQHKVIGGLLNGNVQMVNNRGTPQVTDDLYLYTNGVVRYEEVRHHIWTDAPVKMTDHRSKPQPTEITAIGMDVYLTDASKNPPPATATPKPPRQDRGTEVERVELRSDVRMDIWSDGNGFMASTKPAARPDRQVTRPTALQAAPAQSERAKIVITTHGKFTYDLKTSQATFDIPHRPSRQPEIVRVVRETENAQGKRDQLECDHLELQFTRKNSTDKRAGAAASNTGDNLEIETAHATSQRQDLTLTSDTEALLAFGNDLFYDAQKKLTILKGTPNMVAMKDGNEIQARELWMTSNDSKEAGNEAVAIGPGEMSLLNKTEAGTMERTKARWQDRLVHRKEGIFDCLTLTGDACFEDPERGQRLRADRLKVWMPAAAKTEGKTDTASQRQQPHHVEAKGRVTADAPDMHVTEPTEHLLIWFHDVPALADKTPDAKDGAATARKISGKKAPLGSEPPAAPAASTGPSAGSPPPPPQSTFVGPPAPAKAGSDPEKPRQPMTLSARSIEVHVLRSGARNDLDELWCEGAVKVHQDPDSPEDKGIDIQGETMALKNSPEGGKLDVNGKLAQVQFNKITIVGPKVHIDQPSNQVVVKGIGSLQMLTDTNFDGVKLAKPSLLTTYWKDGMEFQGKNAHFSGAVQARQEGSRLLCQEMQVDFDRAVSLKEGNKDGPPPKIDKVVCQKDVQVEEENYEGKQLLSYKRLVAPELNLDNTYKTMNAPGPGEIRFYQLGGADDPFAPPPPQGNKSPASTKAATGSPAPSPPSPTFANKPKENQPQERKPQAPGKSADTKKPGDHKKGSEDQGPEFKITHVRFRDSMRAEGLDRRIAHFWGNIEAVNAPADRPDMPIDLDDPPPGCFYIHCEHLTVMTHQLADGRSVQEMIGESPPPIQSRVQVRGDTYWGVADVVKFDGAQDRIIFEGRDGALATIYQTKVKGGKQDSLTGKKITYNRKSGLFRAEESTGLFSN
jgi:lipopolysaccharide export system protein LptA